MLKKHRKTSVFDHFRGSTEVECGDPWENRTPDSAVRGLRLNRLTNRPYMVETIGLEPMTLCL